MAPSIEGGAAADLSNLSKSELLAIATSLQSEKDKLKRRNGATASVVEGVSAKGKHYKHVLLSGGCFGSSFYGIKLKSTEQLETLYDMYSEIGQLLAEANL
jgi:hypothetical protein